MSATFVRTQQGTWAVSTTDMNHKENEPIVVAKKDGTTACVWLGKLIVEDKNRKLFELKVAPKKHRVPFWMLHSDQDDDQDSRFCLPNEK